MSQIIHDKVALALKTNNDLVFIRAFSNAPTPYDLEQWENFCETSRFLRNRIKALQDHLEFFDNTCDDLQLDDYISQKGQIVFLKQERKNLHRQNKDLIRKMTGCSRHFIH